MAKFEYWLKMAEEDLKDASLNIENSRFPGSVFHSQQCALKDLNNEYAALIKEYLDKIKNRVTGILLFGSVSRHEELPFPHSDIDMIIIAKDIPSDLFERAEFVRKIENCPSLLQSIWMTEEEFMAQFKAGAGYLLDAIHEGKIIHDTGFFEKIIPQARHELETCGIKRVGRAWVWPVTRSKGIV